MPPRATLQKDRKELRSRQHGLMCGESNMMDEPHDDTEEHGDCPICGDMNDLPDEFVDDILKAADQMSEPMSAEDFIIWLKAVCASD